MTGWWRRAKDEAEETSDGWTEEDEKTGRLLIEEISKQLDVQRQAGTAVDTKAGVVAAAALTGTQFLAAQKYLNDLLLVATLAALALTVVLAYGALRVRDYVEVPDPRGLYFEHRDSKTTEIFFDLAITKAEAYEHNARIYARKARLQEWSLWVLATAALLGVAARLVGD